nr:hypothetical protein [Tanacetum cinerariifolium]
MTSFGYRLNPRYAIKECLSCGALYTGDFCCSKGNVEDKILVPKLPKNCARCGHPVNGPYCQGCTLLQEKLEEDLVTYFQNFQNTSESCDGSTNVVNAPREPFVFKQDHGVNPPHIDECCCECGDVKFNRLSFFATPKVLLLAWDRVFEIKDGLGNKQYKLDDMQELFHKLSNDVQNIHEELAEYINTSGWNRPVFYDDDDDDVYYTIAIIPVLSTEKPDNSLSMGDEHLEPCECLSYGALYTGDFCCSKGNVEDKILVPKLPKNYARCGHPVNGPYCQGCTLLREKLEEDLVTYFQNFQNTSESSDGSTNVVNAPREPFVFKQDHGINPPHIDKCCCECGDALDGIFCQNALVLLLAWDRVFKIKDGLGNKQYKPVDMQELFHKLSNDVQNIHEELAEYINTPGWNRPVLYVDDDDDDVDYTIAITPVLSIEKPDNSLSMGDEHLEPC